MKTRSIRVLAASLAAAVMAGGAGAQAGAGPEAEILAPARESAEASKRESSSATSHVVVILECDSRLWCIASARGGTGEYVSWEWTLANEDFDQGGSFSTADASPYCIPGWVMGLDAVVTDSNGARGVGSITIFCPNS